MNTISIPNYTDLNFWFYYISATSRGFDDDEELSLDDVIYEIIDTEAYIPNYMSWYKDFLPKESTNSQGLYNNPKTISGTINNEITYRISFHLSETTYHLNDIYIGNQGGHFEAWFLTLDELKVFNQDEYLFLLLLPMVAIDEDQREEIENLLIPKLQNIVMFREHATYLAKCIVNGLIIENKILYDNQIGVTNTENHSVRNIYKYPRYYEDVVQLNKALEASLFKN